MLHLAGPSRPGDGGQLPGGVESPIEERRALSAAREFVGKAAIVTGGGAGIGLAIARRLAEGGADVVVPDFNGPAAEAAAAQLKELGVRSLAFQADVADPARMEQVAAATI
ncbi:MAG: SDR family NAD(P)-dependent oxidoreductase, partial [Planctomycetes bacterium]|nr:SDR family NAD(P)-dependent oxidoreductase [Planctomycetota bacterium]